MLFGYFSWFITIGVWMEQIIGFLASTLGVSAPIVYVILPILLLIVSYSLITGKAISLNFAGKTFSIGKPKEEKEEVEEKKVKHVEENRDGCDSCFKKDLYVERAKFIVQENTQYINDMKRNLILQQMNYAEEKLSELRILICKTYSIKLAEKLSVGVITAKEHKDYKFYRMLVNYIIFAKVKDGVVKKALKENHFIELSNIEFEQYMNRKTDLIIDTITEGFDNFYSDDTIIKREEVFYLNETIKRETVGIIKSVFDNARNVSSHYKQLIDKHIEETQSKLEEI